MEAFIKYMLFKWNFKLISNFSFQNGLKVKPQIFSAGTDARCIREVRLLNNCPVLHPYLQAGIPAIGFSPMPNTPVLLHDHDEFINEGTFLKGIDIYVDIIGNLANV